MTGNLSHQLLVLFITTLHHFKMLKLDNQKEELRLITRSYPEKLPYIIKWALLLFGFILRMSKFAFSITTKIEVLQIGYP